MSKLHGGVEDSLHRDSSTLYKVLSQSITFMWAQSVASNTRHVNTTRAVGWYRSSHVSRTKQDSQQRETPETGPEERITSRRIKVGTLRTNIWAGSVGTLSSCYKLPAGLETFFCFHTRFYIFCGENFLPDSVESGIKATHKQITVIRIQ